MKTSPRLFLVLLSGFFISSCQKEISGEPGTGGDGGSTYPYYFTATIDGKLVKYEANDLTTPYGCGTSQPSNELAPTDYDIYEGSVLLDPLFPTTSSVWVHVLKYFNHDPTQAERTAMIKLGDYPYGYSDVSSATVNGASIDYIDENGVSWFSETGPQPSGSTFKIVELTDNSDGTSDKIFKATFNCTLYDLNGTSSIQLTNGVIRGKILSP